MKKEKQYGYNPVILWENELQREGVVISWVELLKQKFRGIFVYILLKIGRKNE